MKKLVLFVFAITVGCVNPSMERGFDKLKEAVLRLQESVELRKQEFAEASAQLDAMNDYLTNNGATQAQLNAVTAQVEGIKAQIQQISETNQNNLQTIEALIQQLQSIDVSVASLMTQQDVQDLLNRISNIRSDINALNAYNDNDLDGVYNHADKCPNTPLEDRNNVDMYGCAPDETPTDD